MNHCMAGCYGNILRTILRCFKISPTCHGVCDVAYLWAFLVINYADHTTIKRATFTTIGNISMNNSVLFYRLLRLLLGYHWRRCCQRSHCTSSMAIGRVAGYPSWNPASCGCFHSELSVWWTWLNLCQYVACDVQVIHDPVETVCRNQSLVRIWFQVLSTVI